MGKIHLLDDSVIDKIAAGEVVERPASVVRELVDNAIDGGALAIDIEVREGGRRSIAVIDNGMGMSEVDLELAIKRHATSKLQGSDDLFSIRTMGFRGEALASIAAISDLTIRSCPEGSDLGVELRVSDGKIVGKSKIPKSLRGTTVLVEALFSHVPARQKFMKSAQSEWAAILELVQAFALSRPELSIKLVHNGLVKLRVSDLKQAAKEGWFGEQALRRRVQDVFGEAFARPLVYARNESRVGQFEGLLSSPGEEKGSSKWIYTFVNRRWVQEKTLRSAIFRGFSSHILRGRYPVVIGFLNSDPSLIDVNVHPAKTQVRFQYEREIQDLMAHAIQNAIRQGAWAVPVVPTVKHEPVLAPSFSLPAFSPKKERLASFGELTPIKRSPGVGLPLFSAPPVDPWKRDPAALMPQKMLWSDYVYLGTFSQCYLIFETPGQELLCVDQHAFHERILFEKLRTDGQALGPSEALLMPETLVLHHDTARTLEENREAISKVGIHFSLEGEGRVTIRKLPTLLKRRHTGKLLEDVAAALNPEQQKDTHAGLDQVFATMACHGAVRAGETLTADELTRLLSQASTVDFYGNCPHGRRVLKFWKKGEVASWFDRG